MNQFKICRLVLSWDGAQAGKAGSATLLYRKIPGEYAGEVHSVTE
jgi:hypothetical protein